MWLAPLLPGPTPVSQPRNVLYIYFDAPIALSAIKLWNYSKTPTRGVQAIQILLDDQIIYDGLLRQAPSKPISDSFGQLVLFAPSSISPFTDFHPDRYDRGELGEQDVLLVDERKFMNTPSQQAAPTIPTGKTHAQIAAIAAGKNSAPRPQTMARGHQ